MTWVLSDIVCNPAWIISTVILGLVVRSQRRGSWDPRACKVELKGKTAIVTGANTGEAQPVTVNYLLISICFCSVILSVMVPSDDLCLFVYGNACATFSMAHR